MTRWMPIAGVVLGWVLLGWILLSVATSLILGPHLNRAHKQYPARHTNQGTENN